MAEPSLASVMLLLGEIKGSMAALDAKVNQLSEDSRSEQSYARISRAKIHERLDEQAAQLSEMDKAVVINAKVDAQTRDVVNDLKTTVTTNHTQVQPYIEDIKRLKMIGWTISGLIALGGLTIGGIVVYATDAAKVVIKNWLN